MAFELHPRLSADTFLVGDLILSRVLLMNDARFPWLMLVPRRPNVAEATDLPMAERSILMEEIASVSTALKTMTEAHRINIAALGNAVAQLHVHVIARFTSDPAWPAPVWGHGTREPYGPDASDTFLTAIRARLPLI